MMSAIFHVLFYIYFMLFMQNSYDFIVTWKGTVHCFALHLICVVYVQLYCD
jgi:hypothetical protein